MFLKHYRNIAGLTGGALVLSLGLSLNSKDYDINSIGIFRLSRAIYTAGKIAVHYKIKLYSSKLEIDSPEYQELRSKVHHEAAEMLLKLCCANKGVYIKVGQHLGTLDFLVPSEYIKVMKVLHSDAPKSSLKSIYKVLREDLKAEPSEIFEDFEEEPLGTASLAQVHKAKLKKDGSWVAVKVQHLLVRNNSKADLKAMEVPNVNWDLTTSRILTMEFVEGVQVTDLSYIKEKKVNRIALTSKLGELYSHMIFKHGFVHSDPHPGNILIKQNDKNSLDIVLLDHGLYATLTEEFRWNYSKFWLSILNRDLNGMKESSKSLGIDSLYPIFICMVTGRTWDAVTGGINKVKYTNEEREAFVSSVPHLLTKIGEVLQTVNREMLLILKTNDLLRGIEHSLCVHQRQPSFIVMTKCCVENLYQERLRLCQSTFWSYYLRLAKQWTMFKLNLYYAYLNVKSRFLTE